MIEMVKGDFFMRTIVSFETAEILESNEIKNCSSRPEIRSPSTILRNFIFQASWKVREISENFPSISASKLSKTQELSQDQRFLPYLPDVASSVQVGNVRRTPVGRREGVFEAAHLAVQVLQRVRESSIDERQKRHLKN